MSRPTPEELAESQHRTGNRFRGLWRHRVTGNLYRVTGAINLLCSGMDDGALALRYHPEESESPEFCRPVGRFLEKFEEVREPACDPT